tara:strand:+ start:171 stop:1202 length:1032 start_codon:yes stop_codon:yes gene_type:complete
MKNKDLYNQKNKTQLIQDIQNESFNRITCSFYKYINIKNLQTFRDKLYIDWKALDVFGRIYIASEGINAQLSIPENNMDEFKSQLHKYELFKNILLKPAVQDGLSFLKLTIKIKDELVAYKIPHDEYDMNNVGVHLNYKKFNEAIENGATLIDMRNYYEGEVGKFKNAIIPDVDISRALLPEIKNILKNKKNEKILMYCTGGIRCEKASSYLIHHGFKDVNQLDGGIIQYANDIKLNNEESKFIGKNFVFDHRLGERITNEIISKCHQCEFDSDTHTNCKNQACHILFIQCTQCSEKFNGCCSKKCSEFIKLPATTQKTLFKEGTINFSAQKSNSVKPKLKKL